MSFPSLRSVIDSSADITALILYRGRSSGAPMSRIMLREVPLPYASRGDVEATKTIREWLDVHGSTWPQVATD